MHVNTQLVGLLTLVLGWGLALAARGECHDLFQQSMRRLHAGDPVALCELVGKRPVLLVNTASHCGFTPQFKGLEALHRQYRERGLVVIGFASDDFRQEADTEAEAAQVCYVNFGVTFTMLAPTAVRGEGANPVFRELARQSQAPDWNFNKYLVDTEGRVVAHFGSRVRPDDKRLRQAIEATLVSRP